MQPFDFISQQPQILSQTTNTRAVFPNITSQLSFTPTMHLEFHSFVILKLVKINSKAEIGKAVPNFLKIRTKLKISNRLLNVLS